MTRRFLTLALIILPLLITSTAIAQPPDTLWTKTWDYGSDYEYMEAVRALPDGGYIATGSVDYYGENIQYWTARLDQSGDEIWLHIEGSPSTDGAHYIEPTSDGGFIQCGEVWGNGFDPYIRKLDADGNEEWRTVIPGWIIGELFYCVREVPAGGVHRSWLFREWNRVPFRRGREFHVAMDGRGFNVQTPMDRTFGGWRICHMLRSL